MGKKYEHTNSYFRKELISCILVSSKQIIRALQGYWPHPFFAGFWPRYDISHISHVHLARWQFPSGKFFLTSFPIINMLYDVRNGPELVVLRPDACHSYLFCMTIKMQKRIMPPEQEYSARRGIAARPTTLPWRPSTPRTPRGRLSPSRMPSAL